MEALMNDEHFRRMRIKRMTQEIRIIAVVEAQIDDDGNTGEEELIIDSLNRPLPIPYSEAQ